MFRLKSLLIICILILSILPFYVQFGEIRSGVDASRYIKLFVNDISVNDDAIVAPPYFIFMKMIGYLLPLTGIIALLSFRSRVLQLNWCFAVLVASVIQFILMLVFLFTLKNLVDAPHLSISFGLLLPLANAALTWFTCNQVAYEERKDDFNYFEK